MKKMGLMALLVGAALFTGLGVTSAMAIDNKCGSSKPAKCGAEKKGKCGAAKCGGEEKSSKCGGDKKAEKKGKCGAGKCGK